MFIIFCMFYRCMNNWKENLDPIIRDHLEMQLRDSLKHKDAFDKSSNPSNAQLWCAVANLSKKLFELNLKVDFLERTIKDIVQEKTIKESKKKKK